MTAHTRSTALVWRRGLAAAAFATALALLLLFHRLVPNTIGNLGSLLETFLPWLGWLVVPLAAWAALRRAPTAAAALVLPLLAWLALFAGLLPDKSDGAHDLRVLSHNVDAANPDPAAAAEKLLEAEADVLALEELTEAARGEVSEVLAAEYPHDVQLGTVGLWSRTPISELAPVDIEIGWDRAMRAVVAAEDGPVAVYVAHLASVRIGSQGFTSDQRDATAAALADAVAGEELDDAVLLGDLNGTMNDRSLQPLAQLLESAQAASGAGFGFTWPAHFPMARIDEILVRGATPTNSWTLERTGSDHLPVAAELRLSY